MLFVVRVVAWVIVPLYVVGTCTSYWLVRSAGLWNERSVVEYVEGVIGIVGLGAFAVVGALLLARRPTNAVSWIIAAIALIGTIIYPGGNYALYVMDTRGRPDALAVFGAWTFNWLGFLLVTLVLIYLPLLFPDGRLPSRRWLPVAVLAGIGPLGSVFLGALEDPMTQLDPSRPGIENPIGIEALDRVYALPIGSVLDGLGVLGVVGAVAAVVVRFRRSRGVERQQMKWFAYVTVIFLGGVPLTHAIWAATGVRWLLNANTALAVMFIVALPIAIGIAILKHRLYDIDLIINRTLVYGSLTVMLASVYVGGVTSLQYIFRAFTAQESTLAVVASTLAIAALFGPLRRRIQGFIDRRFYRSKYDTIKTLEAFSFRLRDETDLEALRDDLVEVVQTTMQPTHVSLWLQLDAVSVAKSSALRQFGHE